MVFNGRPDLPVAFFCMKKLLLPTRHSVLQRKFVPAAIRTVAIHLSGRPEKAVLRQ
jgi:hypothetical protein